MDYPSGDWKYCSCGELYYVYDDELDGGICGGCQGKINARKRRKEQEYKRLKAENKKLKARLKGK